MRAGRVLAFLLACVSCAPALTRDGQLVLTPSRQPGGTILTAHGVEYVDRTYVPKPRVRTSAFEPWQPAGGFLLPADGTWKRVSRPLRLGLPGLKVAVRTSDGLVPAWGGELLLRLELEVPRSGPRRPPLWLGVVLADHAGAGSALAQAALDALGTDDVVAIVDADGSQVVLPPVPCMHRTLASAALGRRLALHGPGMRRDLAWALGHMRRLLAGRMRALPRLLVIADEYPADGDTAHEFGALRGAGVSVALIAADGRVTAAGRPGVPWVTGSESARLAALSAVVPPPAPMAVDHISLSLSSVPAPVHILEASGGEVESDLESDTLRWPAMRTGETRTEVARLSLPVWTVGEPLELEIGASYQELDTGTVRSGHGRFVLRFSDDIYLLGEQRYGDVLAYASALAMVHRLGRAFLGSRADNVDGFVGLVKWQARSMFALSRRLRDPAMHSEGQMLEALLAALYG